MAVAPELIRDINTATESSDPSGFVFVNDATYFSTGGELWRTRGNASDTELVKDIPGEIFNLRQIGSEVYFGVDYDSTIGMGLWKSDGSTQGTLAIYDGFEKIEHLTTLQDDVVFVARTERFGKDQLWKSDGTPLGTELIHEIATGDFFATIDNVTVFNNIILFAANDGVHGEELWRSDGTTDGTVIVKDIAPIDPLTSENRSSNPSGFEVVGNEVFFSAGTADAGFELWKTDGTESGTLLVKDINPIASAFFSEGSYPTGLVNVGGTLFFRANDGSTGYEVWRSDGTETGTFLVKDIVGGTQSSNPRSLTAHDGQLVFLADDGIHGREIWTSDGTSSGTTLVKDIADGDGLGYSYAAFTPFGGDLLFQGADGATWRTDGTESGTSPLPVDLLRHRSNGLQSMGGVAIYAGEANDTGIEPWISDGTSAGTRLIKDINTRNLSSATPGFGMIVEVGGRAYIEAATPEFGRELWTSDGTAERTSLIFDATPGSGASYLNDPNLENEVVAFGDGILFATNPNQGSAFELWKSSPSGNVLLGVFPKIFDTSYVGRPHGFTEFAGEIYFSATSTAHWRELWKTDGTPEGTVMVKDIRPGSGSSYPSAFQVFGEQLYFTAYTGTEGATIWRTDGTTEGTELFWDIDPRSLNGSAAKPTVFDNHLYFAASSESSGTELWKTDGTVQGTSMVADISPGPDSSSPSQFYVVGDKLMFLAERTQMWRSDGTLAGTQLVREFDNSSLTSRVPSEQTIVGNEVYFVIGSGPDRGLWRSDGTAAGTVLVSDNDAAHDLVAVDDTLYFIEGKAIWKSNGTALTTEVIADFSSGNRVEELTLVGESLFFLADNGVYGLEPWRLSVPRQLPDLSIGNVTISANSGVIDETDFVMTWDVTNVGQVSLASQWIDRVYLSADDRIDSADLMLAEQIVDVNTVLAVGETLHQSVSFSVPLDLQYSEGNYRLIVRVDDLGQVSESSRANNVDSASIVSMVLPPLPDLVVGEISMPTNAYSGQSIPVSWTLRNDGAAPISGAWTDKLFVSNDDQIGADQFLGDFAYTGVIAPGETVIRSQSVSLGFDEVGSRWFVVHSETQPGSNELFHQSNNTTLSAESIELSAPPQANLRVTDVIYGSELASGKTAVIEWVVTNNGIASTDAQVWYDAVYLNSTPTLTNAIYLGNVENKSYLEPSESYVASLTVEIPINTVGTHYFIVRADDANHVLEFGNEQDNSFAGGASELIPSPTPDLELSKLLSVDQAFSGQPLQVEYQVTNVGNHPAGFSAGWTDFLWLSDEPRINARSQLLTWQGYPSPLVPGESYSSTATVNLPNDTAGDFYLIGNADGWDDLFEQGVEENNILSKPLQIRLTPPADLEVINIQAPEAVAWGDEVVVTYQVANNGLSETTARRWVDELWLSEDDTLDFSTDQRLIQKPHVGTLGIGDQYIESMTMVAPVGWNVNGFLFVVTNANHAFLELDRSNNSRSALNTTLFDGRPADLIVTAL
ncbi:MAG: hypothetical protein KDB00_16850, partial [Planctomycetales bacterium]|nr:hypothetical protein [Planctomycetales bacterium]